MDRAEKIEKLHELIMEGAKESLIEKGRILPHIAFINTDIPRVIETVPMIFEANKTTYESLTFNAYAAGKYAHRLKVDLVAFCFESCAIQVPKDYKIESWDITQEPSTYPRSMRKEVLFLHSISIPDGENNVSISFYKGGKEVNEPVEILETKLNVKSSKLGLTEYVLKGYNSKFAKEKSMSLVDDENKTQAEADKEVDTVEQILKVLDGFNMVTCFGLLKVVEMRLIDNVDMQKKKKMWDIVEKLIGKKGEENSSG